jgi:hypothetical protein
MSVECCVTLKTKEIREIEEIRETRESSDFILKSEICGIVNQLL